MVNKKGSQTMNNNTHIHSLKGPFIIHVFKALPECISTILIKE